MNQCDISNGNTVSVVIADDHPIFRQAISQALQHACGDSECEILEAQDFDALDAMLAENSDHDLVLLDLFMPGVEGFSGLLYLGKVYPDLPVVMIGRAGPMGRIHRHRTGSAAILACPALKRPTRGSSSSFSRVAPTCCQCMPSAER